jgi:hypothetical protein
MDDHCRHVQGLTGWELSGPSGTSYILVIENRYLLDLPFGIGNFGLKKACFGVGAPGGNTKGDYRVGRVSDMDADKNRTIGWLSGGSLDVGYAVKKRIGSGTCPNLREANENGNRKHLAHMRPLSSDFSAFGVPSLSRLLFLLPRQLPKSD